MRLLWVDAGNGAAGDMLLAALLDAGARLDVVRDGLRRLAVEPIGLDVRSVRRHGLRATQAIVDAPPGAHHRNLADILAVVDAGGFDEPVRRFAHDTFTRLARAEAKVHGVDVAEVHFHEVGALDAIADVVGCTLALADLDLLGAARRVVSPVAVGSGVVTAAHGPIPVPVPAVLELFTQAGAPLAEHRATMELCTPTGAALLCTLATEWGTVPSCVPVATGTGAGSRDPAGHPNVVRVLVGTAAATADPVTSEMYRIDTTVDDLDPRLWPDVLDELGRAGAADAWCTPVLMRKGRPGHVLSALVPSDRVDLVCELVFEHTTSLGVRISPVRRRSLRRDQVEVTVDGAVVHVKRGLLGGRVVTVQPEYDDVRRVAAATGRPVAELLDEVRHTARDGQRRQSPDR
ncbi:nickel pincer cofactor biosynthesis protein LarC [Kutzneria kofuensis]|uniref:Pyridinium-3,5-bisthiocarboxylic acid mononucleotide nickel insertion protein n=1 Tax=Kutzneria kofuensis TaxID=103725 RepID=A0A7W9KUD6_9PSEU|nr:nickel pincer cofactor biosynthesis protein LarC [Kutzneria kofuensis]MBB5898114.1 hypothetical protein [Kutzneria kofuensis]